MIVFPQSVSIEDLELVVLADLHQISMDRAVLIRDHGVPPDWAEAFYGPDHGEREVMSIRLGESTLSVQGPLTARLHIVIRTNEPEEGDLLGFSDRRMPTAYHREIVLDVPMESLFESEVIIEWLRERHGVYRSSDSIIVTQPNWRY